MRGRASRAAAVAMLVLAGLAAGATPLWFGQPGGDDAYYHAMYAVEWARCWQGGVLVPTWYPDLNGGLGGPEPRVRPMLVMVLDAALTLAFDSATAAVAAITVLVPVVGALAMAWAARKVGAGRRAAVSAGVAWAFAPYVLIALHGRTSLQEAFALAIVPAALAALAPEGLGSDRAAVAGGAVLAAIVGSHLLVAFMTGAAVVAVHLLTDRSRMRRLVLAGSIALAVSALSWVPNVLSLARAEGSLFASGWFDWRKRMLLTEGGFSAPWGETMTWLLAAVVLAGFVLLACGGLSRRWGAVSLALAALSTVVAWPVYLVPGMAMIQFPWRWLGVAGAVTVLAAVRLAPGRRAAVLALATLPAVFVDPTANRLPPGPAMRPSDTREQLTLAATRYGVPPILPSSPPMLPLGTRLDAALAAAPGVKAALPSPSRSGPRVWQWQVSRSATGLVGLPLLPDDGWRVSVDGVARPWVRRDGLLAVTVGVGRHLIEARQVWLPEQWGGLAVSILGLVAAALVWRDPRDRPERAR